MGTEGFVDIVRIEEDMSNYYFPILVVVEDINKTEIIYGIRVNDPY